MYLVFNHFREKLEIINAKSQGQSEKKITFVPVKFESWEWGWVRNTEFRIRKFGH